MPGATDRRGKSPVRVHELVPCAHIKGMSQEEENAHAFNRAPRVAVRTDQEKWPRRYGHLVIEGAWSTAIFDTKSGHVTYYGQPSDERPRWTSPTMPLATERKPRFPRVGEPWELVALHPTHGATSITFRDVVAVRFVTLAG